MKGLFVTEAESSRQPTAPEQSSASVEVNTSSAEPTSTTTPILKLTDVDGKVEDKFLEILLGAMNDANTPGFDYLEYKRSLVSLHEMQMDDATRYKSAYAMAKAMEATPAGLQNSAQHYLEILEKEDKKFLESLQAQTSRRLDGKQQEIADSESQIATWQSEIKAIEQKIKEMDSAVAQMKEELQADQAKLSQTKANFDSSYEHLTSQITTDLENIRKYLTTA